MFPTLLLLWQLSANVKIADVAGDDKNELQGVGLPMVGRT